jgi:hypothetical protein
VTAFGVRCSIPIVTGSSDFLVHQRRGACISGESLGPAARKNLSLRVRRGPADVFVRLQGAKFEKVKGSCGMEMQVLADGLWFLIWYSLFSRIGRRFALNYTLFLRIVGFVYLLHLALFEERRR